MRARWIFALLVAASGCFDDGSGTETPCRPACREGFTCVYGTCLSLCNPPCSAGTHCTPIDADRGVCAADLPGDAAAPRDAAGTDAPAGDVIAVDIPAGDPDAAAGDVIAVDIPPPDLPSPADAPAMDAPAMDAPVATDAPAATDRPDAGARDVVAPDAGPCGHPNEPCCAGISCYPGSLCVGATCRGFTAGSTECLSNEDCILNRACSGGLSCGTGNDWRWCYQCLPNGGVARFGERCTSYTNCATGVCNLNRCSYACDPGPAGDGQCQRLGVRDGRCAQIIYGLTPVSDGGVPRAWQTLGACELGCARNGDCATGTACLPISDDLQDRVIFICGTTRATALAGTPCTWGEDCQSGMCISGANVPGGRACSAPCVIDGDCPGAAPVCSPLRLFTSNGTPVQTRGCLPRGS